MPVKETRSDKPSDLSSVMPVSSEKILKRISDHDLLANGYCDDFRFKNKALDEGRSYKHLINYRAVPLTKN